MEIEVPERDFEYSEDQDFTKEPTNFLNFHLNLIVNSNMLIEFLVH